MDSKPRKTRKDKGVKRKAKGKGKKIAKGAKKLFETDLLALQRRPPQPRVAQQQQPVFNLNISQNLRNIVGAFASASTAANYAKTQEINRQAADATYRAETITQLSRDNFLASLEKQRLERKVERGERAYAGAVAQADRRIQQLGDSMFSMFAGGGAAAQPRRPASRQARVMEIVSMSDSDAPFEGFSDVPPSRQLSAEAVRVISRQVTPRANASPPPTPRLGRVQEAEERGVLYQLGSPIAAISDVSIGLSSSSSSSSEAQGGGGGAAYAGGGGAAYASQQYLQNQPRGKPVIVDAASARTERPKRRGAVGGGRVAAMAAAINQGQNLSDANIAAEKLRRQQVSASAADPVVVTGGVAVAGGGGGAAPEAPRKKLQLRLKPEAIARLKAEAAAGQAAAAAAAPASGSTTETESSGTISRRISASTPQRLRAAEIRKQVSAAAGVPQKSIRFAQGKGSRKAVSGVDWVATIADLKRKGLSGAAAIEAIKQKHAGVLE
jgi:hypothetical protein